MGERRGHLTLRILIPLISLLIVVSKYQANARELKFLSNSPRDRCFGPGLALSTGAGTQKELDVCLAKESCPAGFEEAGLNPNRISRKECLREVTSVKFYGGRRILSPLHPRCCDLASGGAAKIRCSTDGNDKASTAACLLDFCPDVLPDGVRVFSSGAYVVNRNGGIDELSVEECRKRAGLDGYECCELAPGGKVHRSHDNPYARHKMDTIAPCIATDLFSEAIVNSFFTAEGDMAFGGYCRHIFYGCYLETIEAGGSPAGGKDQCFGENGVGIVGACLAHRRGEEGMSGFFRFGLLESTLYEFEHRCGFNPEVTTPNIYSLTRGERL